MSEKNDIVKGFLLELREDILINADFRRIFKAIEDEITDGYDVNTVTIIEVVLDLVKDKSDMAVTALDTLIVELGNQDKPSDTAGIGAKDVSYVSPKGDWGCGVMTISSDDSDDDSDDDSVDDDNFGITFTYTPALDVLNTELTKLVAKGTFALDEDMAELLKPAIEAANALVGSDYSAIDNLLEALLELSNGGDNVVMEHRRSSILLMLSDLEYYTTIAKGGEEIPDW